MPKRLTCEKIVDRSSQIHNNKYEYKFQNFRNGRDKIEILCPNHGIFKQSIESHLTGKGYDGLQHYQPINYFGGLDNFEKQKNRDNIKDNFCKKMGIKLLRISYKDDIGKKLNEYLNEFSI